MKPGPFLVALVLLGLLALVAFLLLRPGPAAPPALPSSNETAAASPREDAEPAPSASPQPVDLGLVPGRSELADCGQPSALASILEQMVRIDPETFESRRGGPIEVPGHARPLVPTFERTREVEGSSDIRAVAAELDLSGRWHGLAVTGLRRSFYEESDASSFEIRFAESPERVRDALLRQGFRLPAVGEFAEVGDDQAIGVSIGVERSEGGAALICATG